VWIRGILADHYGVAVGSVRYRTGGLHQPGRTDKISHSHEQHLASKLMEPADLFAAETREAHIV
jgi:hypothetical protein